MATGNPVILPRDGQVWDPWAVYIDRCVITADSDASSETFDLLINDCDADTDLEIPIFSIPAGVWVMDVGMQISVEFTTAASLVIGHSSDDNYWLATDHWHGSDLTQGIVWSSRILSNLMYTSGTDQAASTALATVGIPVLGGVIVEPSTADDFTNDSVALSSTFESSGNYVMTLRNDEAVAEAGLLIVWIQYSLAPSNMPFPDSALITVPGERD